MADPATAVVATVKGAALVTELWKTGASIVMVYSTHYGSSKLYNLVCVPEGLQGVLWGLITTASPWCKLIMEVMNVTQNQYSTIIMVVLSRLLLSAIGV